MLPCTVVRCGASTLLRCGACGTAAFCSLACAAEEWPEHRSACFGPLAKRQGVIGDWLPAPEPLLAVDAPARSTLKGENAKLADEESALPPHAGAGAAPAEEEAKEPAALMCAYPPCDLPRIGFCTRCLLVGWCSVEHQKAHWKAGHKAVCAPAETKVVPCISWEQRIMAEAAAAAPASLAAMAELPPLQPWKFIRDGVPPAAIVNGWRKAAEGGHAYAQFVLAQYYVIAKHIPDSEALTLSWHAKAAAQGLSSSQCCMGAFYECDGATQDFKLAFEYHAKAATQGCAISQCCLAGLYERGEGVAQDYKLAVEWYTKAAAQGDAGAKFRLGICGLGRGGAVDQKLAFEWIAKAAAQDYAQAQFFFGTAYEHGDSVARNLQLAADYYGKAAAQGLPEAVVRRDACLAQIARAASAQRS